MEADDIVHRGCEEAKWIRVAQIRFREHRKFGQIGQTLEVLWFYATFIATRSEECYAFVRVGDQQF